MFPHKASSPVTSAMHAVSAWARVATTSFSELVSGFGEEIEDDVGIGRIYRLKQWPELTQQLRTAGVYRALSVMTHRPVNRHWLGVTTRLKPKQLDRLMDLLSAQDALHVIDTSGFAAAV